MRANEKDCTQPTICSGLASKHVSGLVTTLDTNVKIVVAVDKSDHEFIYSVSSGKAGNDQLDKHVSSPEELDSESTIEEQFRDQHDVASTFDLIHEDFSEIQEEFQQLFGQMAPFDSLPKVGEMEMPTSNQVKRQQTEDNLNKCTDFFEMRKKKLAEELLLLKLNDIGVDPLTPQNCFEAYGYKRQQTEDNLETTAALCTEASLKAYGDNTYQYEKENFSKEANKVSQFSLKTPQQILTQPSQEEIFNKSPLNFTKESPKRKIVNVNQKTLGQVLEILFSQSSETLGFELFKFNFNANQIENAAKIKNNTIERDFFHISFVSAVLNSEKNCLETARKMNIDKLYVQAKDENVSFSRFQAWVAAKLSENILTVAQDSLRKNRLLLMSGSMLKPDLPTLETPVEKIKLLLPPKQILVTKVDDLRDKSTLNLSKHMKLPAKAFSAG